MGSRIVTLALLLALMPRAARPQSVAVSGSVVDGSLDDLLVSFEERSTDLLALNEALERLAAMNPQQGRIVELRFFGGLSVEETAEVLHVSSDTIKRDWRLAKLWLLHELEGSAP